MDNKEDQIVEFSCLQNLKRKISSEWRDVGRRLGLEEGQLNNLTKDKNFEGQENITYGMLCAWKTKAGQKATYEVLSNALRWAGRVDLAEDLLMGTFDGDIVEDNISEVPHNISTRAGPGVGGSDAQTSAGPTPNKVPRTVGNDVQTPVAPARVHHYKMSNKPRGKCLILTYDDFEGDEEWKRSGNDVDEENLTEVFETLGFDVESGPDFNNLNKEDTMKEIKKMARKRNFDSFVLVVCSHGNEEAFFSSDKESITIQDVLTPFKVENCKGFAQKPKMFFFNTCRGNEKEEMVKYEMDRQPVPKQVGVATNLSYYRPNEADFCVVLSTVPGYVGWRHTTEGTCFVQNLCKSLKENYKTHHLMDILTMGTDTLLREFEAARRESGDKSQSICQVPHITFTLSKAVYFVDE